MRHDPLKALIHIPKTAGTSMNAQLAAHGGRGRKHIEQLAGHPWRLARLAARADWVSGHLPLRDMQAQLGAVTDRPLEIYAFVRDPIAQVASHYNWWYVVWHRGPLSWWRQAAPFRALSRRIRAADPTDPDQVIAILRDNAPLFLNMQADYLLGTRTAMDPAAIRAALTRLAFVGLNDDLPALCAAMGLPAPKQTPRRNVSPYYFDKRVFWEGPVRDFLEDAHAGDIALFQAVQRMRGKDRAAPADRPKPR
ncbi:hypothetical protein [Marimonas arenosa]|uniref:Sulfotransferase family protein n=1 Tax=Marimonas arenosa TaxID=1795305 RepID=A0AAE4B3X4_9RHOB|nr:hypothetical protein [Marimonas arenosa]MDQ2088834.1 hypothetical protein [Marimonas arenosa]